jgi:hypothetical protein
MKERGKVRLARRQVGHTVIDIETTGTLYEIKQDGITKMVLAENEARSMLSALIDAVGLHYFVSNVMLQAKPALFTELESMADALGKE